MDGTRLDRLTFRGISVNLTRLTPPKTRDALRDRGFNLSPNLGALLIWCGYRDRTNPPTHRRARGGHLKISTCPLICPHLLTQLRLGDDNLSYRRDMTIPNVRSGCACCRPGRRFRSVSLQTLLTGLGSLRRARHSNKRRRRAYSHPIPRRQANRHPNAHTSNSNATHLASTSEIKIPALLDG